jgi:hypothetical protein
MDVFINQEDTTMGAGVKSITAVESAAKNWIGSVSDMMGARRTLHMHGTGPLTSSAPVVCSQCQCRLPTPVINLDESINNCGCCPDHHPLIHQM